MNKKGELVTAFVIGLTIVIIVAGVYLSSTSIDKNINYIGDSKSKLVYATLNCMNTINNIPIDNRVAFQTTDEITQLGYFKAEVCPNG